LTGVIYTEESYLLGYDTVYSVESLHIQRWKVARNQQEAGSKQSLGVLKEFIAAIATRTLNPNIY
jgi:hypothetical protein